MRNLLDYARICLGELEAIGIKYGKIAEFKVNTRAKGRWGQCVSTPKGFSIEINARLLDERNDAKGLKETILHEILHTCEGCMAHNAKWKALASKVNRVYGYNIKTKSSAESKGVPDLSRYMLKCTSCGKIVATRMRKCKIIEHPEQFRCKFCNGKLVVLVNNNC